MREIIMRNTILFLIISGLALLESCKDKGSEETEEMRQIADETASSTFISIPHLSDDYLVSVYETQELIKITQEDKELRKKYCENAFLKEHNLFISMGIGSLRNPKNGQPVPRHFAERAATIDAQRWASYGETWLKNNYEPSFGKLNSYFNRTVEIINKSVVGDSLFIFIATRMD
jgi:hypothetical protein